MRWLGEREERQEDGLAEKSRDVGFTWLCCAYALHGWLFRQGFSAGFGSRKEALVDRIGDPDTIFEKIRILYRHLPDWQKPAGFKESEHDNHLRLLNPANGSTITGEGGDNIGRGGRKSIYFVDEAAFLVHPQSIEAALSQNSNVKIWVSTPNGPGNPFATKRHGGKVKIFTFHWKHDPRKDEAWYQRQKETLDPVTLAQEVDIDYTASIEGICIPAKWVRAAVGLELPASGPVVGGYDVAEEGLNENVVIARQGPVVRPGWITTWGQLNTTQSAHRAADEAARFGITTLNYDCDGVGAGVKGAWASTERTLTFKPNPLRGCAAASDTVWPDGKSSKERFLNLRAEMWWTLRLRFEKAYEFKELGTAHPPEEMISIPDDPGLIAQLSQPLAFPTETGKIKLESKPDMKKRGVASPDKADALAYAFAPAGGGWDPSVFVRAVRR